MSDLTFSQKITTCLFCFAIALVGFMIKLPPVFRHHDKEMHFLFYFCSAGFLNLLFRKRHAVIFIFLLFFGIFIEFFQSFSNRFFTNRIHGNFDKEDITYNLAGLILFSVIWLGFRMITFIFKKLFK